MARSFVRKALNSSSTLSFVIGNSSNAKASAIEKRYHRHRTKMEEAMTRHVLKPGRGAGNRHHHAAAAAQSAGFASHAAGAKIPVQAKKFVAPHYPFQPLPTPLGAAPYRFDLSQLLDAQEVAAITKAGKMVFHSVGDTGDSRGQQMDFVAAMMTQD